MNQKTNWHARNQVTALSAYTTGSLVDPQWEISDPNPDIFTLFNVFNIRFFWRVLDSVEVKWSPRMTSCAGICCFKGKRGGCVISLSLPLLKLRPRKDLIETLLHEMIHAYLFITNNNKDRDGHGPEFHKHMYRINQESGTHITVYHSFHDEVKHYQTHWWRCEGPCKDRPPYYGYVKRSMNRAPGPNDYWFPSHQQTCGGVFTKIMEPEGFKAKKSKNKSEPLPEITKYFSPINSADSKTSEGTQKCESASSTCPKTSETLLQGGSQMVPLSGSSSIVASAVGTSNAVPKSSKTSLQGELPMLPLRGSNSTIASTVGTPNALPKPSKTPLQDLRGGSSSTASAVRPSPAKLTSKDISLNPTSSKAQGFVPFHGHGYVLGNSGMSSKSKSASSLRTLPHSSPVTHRPTVPTSRNTVLASDPVNVPKSKPLKNVKEVECPVCLMKFNELEINFHVDGCLESAGSNKRPNKGLEKGSIKLTPFCNELNNKVPVFVLSDDSEEDDSAQSSVKCPVCGKSVEVSLINPHLDTCVSLTSPD